jgi:CubicO group peptidase (beta-lactamase class C family)
MMAPAPESNPTPDWTSLAKLEALLHQDVADKKLPGAVCLLVHQGQTIWSVHLGRLDPNRSDPMPMDAIFRIYSMTKPVVCAAALMLVAQGLLSLDQPVHEWLPEFLHLKVAGLGDHLDPADQPITVRDLLSHTAGLAYDFTGTSSVHRQYAKARLFNRRRSSCEFIHDLAQLPLLDHPGRSFSYSHATDVLGCLLEVLQGQPLGQILKQHIFDPLGMHDTAFHVDSSNHYRIAQPFAQDPDTGRPVLLFDVQRAPNHDMGGAGLVSTASDYARFLQMLLSGDLLPPSIRHPMMQDQLKGRTIMGNFLPQGDGFGWGLAVGLKAHLAGLCYWEGLAGTSFLIHPGLGLHAQLLIQQPTRRAYYGQLLRDAVRRAFHP